MEIQEIRERMVANLAMVDSTLAERVAADLGFKPDPQKAVNNGTPKGSMKPSPALSILAAPPKASIATRKVAILAADGVSTADVETMKKALQAAGAKAAVLAPRLGNVSGTNGGTVTVDHTIVTMPSVVFDAVFVPGGAQSVKTLASKGDAVHFVQEAYKHAKPVCVFGDGALLLETAGIHAGDPKTAQQLGVIVGNVSAASNGAPAEFIQAIARGRFFDRPDMNAVPA